MAGERSDVKVRFLGDDSQLSRVFGRVDKTAGRVGSKLSSAGKTMGKVGLLAGGALAAGAAAGGAALWAAGEAAADDAKGQAVLAGVLKRTNGARKADVASVEDWISKQSLATGMADDQLRPALGKLLIAGVKTADAQKQLALAQDISVASGKDLNTVTEAMGKAALGSVGGLSRLGLATKDADGKTLSYEKILAKASKTMGGAAAEAAETTAGKMDRLKIRFGELQETVGGGVINAMDGAADVFGKKVMPVLERLGEKVVPVLQRMFSEKLEPALRSAGRLVTTSVLPALKWLGDLVIGTIIPAVVKVAGAMYGGLKSAFDSIQKAVERNRPGLEKLGTVFAGLAKFVAGTLAPVLGTVLGASFKLIGWLLGSVVIPAVGKLGDIFTWLWNKVVAPVTRFMLNAFGSVASFYAGMLRGLSKVPGFGWAKTAADALDRAAGKARSLANGVKEIPSRKDVKVVFNVRGTGKVQLANGVSVDIGQYRARASGGPVRKGETYLVGEKGPELMTAATDGYVTDATKSAAIMRGSSGGGAVAGSGGGVVWTGNVILTGQVVDPLGAARQIRELLSQLSRTEGVPIAFGGLSA